MVYDLVIKGGRVVDPAQNIDGVMDVVVNGAEVAGVLPDISPADARNIIDASGRIVTPGLIDAHAHIYNGFLNNGADPEVVGVYQGVTTVVDGGSAGHAIFEGFPKYVIPATRTAVYCFLHIGSFGLAVMPELWYPEEINTAATEAVMRKYPELIKGVKIRLVGKFVAGQGTAVVKTAQKTAKKFQLPLMVHIGDRAGWASSSLTREILPLLEAGDILSHIYTALPGTLLGDDGRVFPELLEARDRGVVLDVAGGISNLAYATTRKMIAQGIVPTTLSTDVNKSSVTGPAYGLTVCMSKFLELGFALEEIIRMTTLNPAKAVKIDAHKGSLKAGMDADISVLDIQGGSWRFPDNHEGVLTVTKLIRPFITIRAGVPIPPLLMPIKE